MIQLRKSIKVGPTIVPAGTILHNRFQSNVVYYRGTKILIDKIPQEALAVPGIPADTVISTESKHVGDRVIVKSYATARLGDVQVIDAGKLESIGKFAALRRTIATEDANAYEHIAAHCKTGRETVWKLNNKWYCNDGCVALEDAALQIVPAEGVANTDNIMYNGSVVARIVSPSLARASYPDDGYLNSKSHQLTVLNNDNQPIDLNCITKFDTDDSDKTSEEDDYEGDDADSVSGQADYDGSEDAEGTDDGSADADSEVVLAQDILDELAPILQGNESLRSDLPVDCCYINDDSDKIDNSWTSLEIVTIRAIVNLLKDSFDKVKVFTDASFLYICVYATEQSDVDKPKSVVKFEHNNHFFWLNPEQLPFDMQRPAQYSEEAAVVRKVIDIVAPDYIQGAVDMKNSDDEVITDASFEQSFND